MSLKDWCNSRKNSGTCCWLVYWSHASNLLPLPIWHIGTYTINFRLAQNVCISGIPFVNKNIIFLDVKEVKRRKSCIMIKEEWNMSWRRTSCEILNWFEFFYSFITLHFHWRFPPTTFCSILTVFSLFTRSFVRALVGLSCLYELCQKYTCILSMCCLCFKFLVYIEL